MKKTLLTLLFSLALALGSTVAGAATIGLFDYSTTGGVANFSAFDLGTGLGTVKITATGVGSHYSALFVDHEIDEVDNTWFNETGATSGAAAAGQSWEIDEPGWFFGDIIGNFDNNTLDNSIFGGLDSLVEDVSMALGWNYVLGLGETATMTFVLSEIAPGGFYLEHHDPDSVAAIYFSSSMRISEDNPAVPEPSTLLLLGAGFLGLGLYGRRRGKG